MAEKTSKLTLADQVQGRIIHASVDITLTPSQDVELGDTDNAFDVGHLLVDGALRLLKNAAEKNGFKVEIETRFVVY